MPETSHPRSEPFSISREQLYAEDAHTWSHGEKTEDELLQRIWNLSESVLRACAELARRDERMGRASEEVKAALQRCQGGMPMAHQVITDYIASLEAELAHRDERIAELREAVMTTRTRARQHATLVDIAQALDAVLAETANVASSPFPNPKMVEIGGPET